MKRIVLSAICLLTVAACETPVVYAPAASPRSSGFTEQKIEADRIRVSFRGAGPPAQINDYALLRAADLTLQEGYDWFRIVRRDQDMAPNAGRSSVSLGTGSTTFGRHSSVGFGVGLGTFDLSGGPMRTVSLEIKLGKGATPDDRDVYDARSVARSIRSRTSPPPR